MIFFRSIYSKWFSRIISLVMAISLWQYVYHKDQLIEKIVLPIQFSIYPSNLYTEPNNLKNKMVIAKISGRKDNVREAYNIVRNLKCYVNLINAKKGFNTYSVNIMDIEKDKSFNWVLSKVNLSLNKDTISIPFQEMLEKELPIKFNMDKKLKNRMEILNIDYKPKKAKIIGPENYVNNLKLIESHVFNIKNIFYKDFKKIVNLIKPKSPINLISPKKLIVSVDIDTSIQNLKFMNVKVLFINNLSNFHVSNQEKIKLEYITYRGSENLIKKLTSKSVVAYIDLSQYKKAGEYLALVYPQEFEQTQILEFFPKKLKIILTEKKGF